MEQRQIHFFTDSIGIRHAGVDIFFVISGFIMAYTRRDNAAGMRDARVFITRRIERVIPLYWLWTIAVLILWIAGFIHKAHPFPGIKTIIASLLLWPLANTIEPFQPVLSQGWTLSFEAYFYVFFAAALMVRVPDRFMAAFLSLVFLAIFLVARNTTHDASVLYLTGSPLICEFIFGMVAAQIAKMIARMAIGTRLAYFALAAAVIAFFCDYLRDFTRYFNRQLSRNHLRHPSLRNRAGCGDLRHGKTSHVKGAAISRRRVLLDLPLAWVRHDDRRRPSQEGTAAHGQR